MLWIRLFQTRTVGIFTDLQSIRNQLFTKFAPPVGGTGFDKSQFPVFVRPCGRRAKWENAFLLVLKAPLRRHNNSICAALSFTSKLERRVLKKLIQRTSQRVEWTSGARDMINLFYYCFLNIMSVLENKF